MERIFGAFFLSSLVHLSAGSVELLVAAQRQMGTSQTKGTGFTYKSNSIEFLFEPNQSPGSPIFQWSIGIGSGSQDQTEYNPGPEYSIRRVQPSTYFSSGIRLQSSGNFQAGAGLQFRLRADQLKGGTGYDKERQNAVEGVLLIFSKGLISIPNSPLKVILGAHFGFIATNDPYPNRELALFSGLRF